MKEQKKKVFTWRINLFIFIIFSLGAIFGIAISGIQIPSLEGYLYSRAQTIVSNSLQNVDDPYCFATSSNATYSNATYSNATCSNATYANASSNDASNDFILLTQLTADNNTAKAGERIYLQCYTYGNCLNGATLTFYNESLGMGITTQLEFEGDNTFITIPEETVAGTYDFQTIILNATSYGTGTFTKTYNAGDLENKLSIVVEKADNAKDIELKSVKFEKDEVKIGDKLGVTIETDEEINSAKFTFKNTEDEKSTVAYMKKDGGKEYISFSSNTPEGTYDLTTLVLSNAKSTTIYSKEGAQASKEYSFDNKIKVTKGETSTLEYNNEDITSDIITEIATSTELTKLVINADSKSVISEDLFNAIKGKDVELVVNYKGNQFIFNGRDMTTTKDIDVSVKSYSLSSRYDEIKNLIGEKGVIVNFASNGNLPSKARVKIKQTADMKSVLGTNSIYVYYYDELTQKFEEVAKNVTADSENYYTFSITHNSKFLLTTEKLDDSLLQEGEENVVSFLMSNKVYLILIILAVLLIVVVIVVIIVYNKKKGKKNNYTVDNTKRSGEVLTDKKVEEKIEEKVETKEKENSEEK